MTVCIGLVCNQAKNILIAADTRASYGTVTSNDQAAKLFDLPGMYFGAVAGTLAQCEDIISELYHRMAQLNQGDYAPELVRKCVLDSYDQIYATLADEALRNDPRITLEQYLHDKKLSTRIRQYARDVLKVLEIDVDLIVAGFYRSAPAQFVVSGGTAVKIRPEISPGNAVIGSGGIAALNWLNYRKQNHNLGLAHSILHITEAKQFAEVEGTVGPWRQMMLLWPDGFKPLEGGDELMQSWWHRYGLPLSDGLEQDAHNQAACAAFGLEKSSDGFYRAEPSTTPKT